MWLWLGLAALGGLGGWAFWKHEVKPGDTVVFSMSTANFPMSGISLPATVSARLVVSSVQGTAITGSVVSLVNPPMLLPTPIPTTIQKSQVTQHISK